MVAYGTRNGFRLSLDQNIDQCMMTVDRLLERLLGHVTVEADEGQPGCAQTIQGIYEYSIPRVVPDRLMKAQIRLCRAIVVVLLHLLLEGLDLLAKLLDGGLIKIDVRQT